MGDAPWLGRPVEVDSDQIETLRTIDVISWEIANILEISKSIKLLVKMKTLFCRKNHMDFLANPIPFGE